MFLGQLAQQAATTELTTTLFKAQAKDPTLIRAEALRRAMVGLIDGPGRIDPKSRKVIFSYAHPLFWAPFTVIGAGGGARPTS
jgi:CHAT domain-containing protein